MQIPLPGPHSDWPAGGEGGGHAFSWGTLTEDEEVLELIQSWKQTQGDRQRLGGDLAVALVWVETGLGGWAMAGSWLGRRFGFG